VKESRNLYETLFQQLLLSSPYSISYLLDSTEVKLSACPIINGEAVQLSAYSMTLEELTNNHSHLHEFPPFNSHFFNCTARKKKYNRTL
jgi:hypothetical protein